MLQASTMNDSVHDDLKCFEWDIGIMIHDKCVVFGCFRWKPPSSMIIFFETQQDYKKFTTVDKDPFKFGKGDKLSVLKTST